MIRDQQITVAVTGLNAIDNPGPGIPVIRSLRAYFSKIRIIGLSYEALEPGIFMHDLVNKTYQLPLPSAGTTALYNRLKQIHGLEKLDVIIPNFDSELYNFILLRTQLEELGIRTFMPDAEAFEQRQKIHLADFGKSHGVEVPHSATISKPVELQKLPASLTYPLMLKGKFYDASLVYNPEQATSQFHRIAAKWGTPLILQEFVSGEEVNVTAIGDGEGNMTGMVAMRKQYVTDKGKAWSGVSITDDKLAALSKKIIRALKWRGGLELEVIRTDNEKYYLLEINPRFPAWVYLATGCGQNHPAMLVRMALGEKVNPVQQYDAGKLFVRYSFDMIVDLKEYEKIATLGEL